MTDEALDLFHEIVGGNCYLILATADADGVPWSSPVWFASADPWHFVWGSKPGAQHSRNIAVRPEVAISIFDSTQRPGTGRGFADRRVRSAGRTGCRRSAAVRARRAARTGTGRCSRSRPGSCRTGNCRSGSCRAGACRTGSCRSRTGRSGCRTGTGSGPRASRRSARFGEPRCRAGTGRPRVGEHGRRQVPRCAGSRLASAACRPRAARTQDAAAGRLDPDAAGRNVAPLSGAAPDQKKPASGGLFHFRGFPPTGPASRLRLK